MKEKNKLDQKSKNNYKVGLYLILTFFALWYIEHLSNFLLASYGVIRPMILGFAIAFVIDLPMTFFQEKVFGKFIDPIKHRKLVLSLSLILSWLLFFAIITLILVVVIPELIKAVQSAIINLPAFIDALIDSTKRFPAVNEAIVDFKDTYYDLDIPNISAKVTNYISGNSSNLLNRAQNIISNVSSGLVAIAMGFIFSIYVSINKRALKLNANRTLYANFKESTADQINYVFKLTYDAFSKFLNSRIVSCIVLGTLNYIGMKILRLPYAGMISILVGALDIIPYFGPIIASVVGVILIFIESPFKSLVFIIFLVILQQLQENVFYPIFIGKNSGLPAIWIFVSVFLGGRLFGIAGMILFMPLATVIYTLSQDSIAKKLKEKDLDRITVAEKSNRSFDEMREERLRKID
ncbi:AI-2E family transporter [Anaerococcus sp.]|uniref:AI-2E family transporter n=1 Tax=Anaerococcus sp. TaxID=1872515 RepID=UPI0025897307|nr:AI-2E family transporter [Anaerococcus sp.]MDU3212041.1 AI-2E family transporter [Anaerococcus sp.]